MSFPLISPDWDFALWAVLIGIAGFGFWADSTRFGRQVSGVGIMLAVAMIFGNLGVIPHAAPAYDVVWNFLIPVAVPLLLLKANLRRIIPETGPMLGAFILGVAEVVVSSLACIGGPVAPAAIAASRGWRALVTPGLMVGILGYAIANFIGVGLARLLA